MLFISACYRCTVIGASLLEHARKHGTSTKITAVFERGARTALCVSIGTDFGPASLLDLPVHVGVLGNGLHQGWVMGSIL